MTPSQIAKSNTERGHQTAFFAFCAIAHLYGFDVAHRWNQEGDTYLSTVSHFVGTPQPVIPALKWIHAIHNQGHGDAIRGAAAKAEGVRAGVADIFLPYPHADWHGLYIEMKKPEIKPKRQNSKGGVSSSQNAFRDYALKVGYGWCVCYGWREAVGIVQTYLEWR